MPQFSALAVTAVALALAQFVHAADPTPDLRPIMDRALPSLLATYKSLHQNPELSHHEAKTSTFLAQELQRFGYDVTERIGKYDNPAWTGYGVMAVMRNGRGPTLLVRTELDALPVEEKTGLPYASRAKTLNDSGQEVSVMHACGHDLHLTSLIGAAQILAALKDRWSGTLEFIGQPAEETVNGARAMLKDSLYSRFPKPDVALALHDTPLLAVGQVGLTPGDAFASATSIEIVVRGAGGHGSRPESTKDPIVVAAQLILALQTTVSRENSPFDPAVVTVGSFQAGTKNNIIPDEARLLLTVRSFREESRLRLISSIKTKARHIALAAGIPESLAPIVTITESTPATYNDPALSDRLSHLFSSMFGPDNTVKTAPIMGSEDFGEFGLENHSIPACMWWLGASDPASLAESKRSGEPLPYLHSSKFAPVPEPAIRTGVLSMSAAILDLLNRPQR